MIKLLESTYALIIEIIVLIIAILWYLDKYEKEPLIMVIVTGGSLITNISLKIKNFNSTRFHMTENNIVRNDNNESINEPETNSSQPLINKEKLKRAVYHIQTRLKKRGGQRASFEAIRNEVDESYSDDDLKKIIDMNPDIFSRCTIQSKSGNKPGITLVKIDKENK